jgi:hypothetical protein
MVSMAKDLGTSPGDKSQPAGWGKSRAGSGRPASIQLVLGLMSLMALTVIAAALVVIAVDQTRQTRNMSRSDCAARANDYRPDTFAITPTYLADVAKACGLKSPYTGRS